MVLRGKASQVPLGRGGNWTAGEEKGGASFWETSRGRDRLLWAVFPFRPLRVPRLALERADRKVVEAGVAYWLLPQGILEDGELDGRPVPVGVARGFGSTGSTTLWCSGTRPGSGTCTTGTTGRTSPTW